MAAYGNKSISTLKNLYHKGQLLVYRFATVISPTVNTKIRYKAAFGRAINLKNPNTFNEKILWLKLNRYMESPLVIQCADKLRVREYVKRCGCGEYLNDLLGVYRVPDEIEWDSLPKQFVLKWNFGAGGNIICSDKSKLNETEIKKSLKKWKNSSYWLDCSEMHYKYIEPMIVCERLLNEHLEDWKVPEDYKIFCFHGKAKYVMICKDRFIEKKPIFLYFDRDWTEMPFDKDMLGKKHPAVEKPKCMEKMFELAETLSKPFPFVRVDFFCENGKIVFGELTFTPSAGLDTDLTQDAEICFGELINLNESDVKVEKL